MLGTARKAAASIGATGIQRLQFGPWTGGLRTDKAGEHAARNEFSEALNVTVYEGGVVRTRPGCYSMHLHVDGAVRFVADARVSGKYYTIIACDDGKLYYRSHSEISTLVTEFGIYQGSDIFFLSFNDQLFVFDGGPIRFWNGPGTGLEMVYDDGIGATSAYQINTRYETPSSGIMAGKVIQRFTTVKWDVSYTLPPTRVFAWLSKTGEPTGAILIKIYRMDGTVPDPAADYLVAEKTLEWAENLTTLAQEYYALFSKDDVYEELTPQTDYYLLVDYAGPASESNNVQVWLYSGGTGAGKLTGDVYEDLTGIMVCAVSPGPGPSGEFAIVHENRMFVIEGMDGEHPSWLWYCAAGNPLDWSTPDGGGYADIDREIGAIASFYNSVWVFGTWREPHLSRLTGNNPAAYSLGESLQNVSADWHSVVTAPDDVWFLHLDGVGSIRTIQEFGDIRSFSQTSRVRHIMSDRFNIRATFAGYEPDTGVYLLKLLDGTGRLYAVHTKAKSAYRNGDVTVAVAPVTLWEFRLPEEEKITALGAGVDGLIFGTSEGDVYLCRDNLVHDDALLPEYAFSTNYMTTRFGESSAIKLNFSAFGLGAGSFDIEFYVNHSRTPHHVIHVDLPDDEPFTDYYDRIEINFNFRALMVRVCNIKPSCDHLHFGEIQIAAKSIGGY